MTDTVHSPGPEAEALLALKARQGKGARWDAPSAPRDALALARRGTAYFARKLMELPDDALGGPSRIPGLSRRALIAEVAYQARALTRLAEWARTGKETPMWESEAVRLAEIELGATLPARALRHLFDHSAIHLNVEWRDLTDAQWDAVVRDHAGAEVALRDLPMARARLIWRAAVDLGNGGREADIPAQLRAA